MDPNQACSAFAPVEDRAFGCEILRRGLSCANQATLQQMSQTQQQAQWRIGVAGAVAAVVAFAGGYWLGSR
jgi:hypothetical protein